MQKFTPAAGVNFTPHTHLQCSSRDALVPGFSVVALQELGGNRPVPAAAPAYATPLNCVMIRKLTFPYSRAHSKHSRSPVSLLLPLHMPHHSISSVAFPLPQRYTWPAGANELCIFAAGLACSMKQLTIDGLPMHSAAVCSKTRYR